MLAVKKKSCTMDTPSDTRVVSIMNRVYSIEIVPITHRTKMHAPVAIYVLPNPR